jgi:hypothetical protein
MKPYFTEEFPPVHFKMLRSLSFAALGINSGYYTFYYAIISAIAIYVAEG